MLRDYEVEDDDAVSPGDANKTGDALNTSALQQGRDSGSTDGEARNRNATSSEQTGGNGEKGGPGSSRESSFSDDGPMP